MNKLTTKWGSSLAPSQPKTEYPRPTMQRDSYYCLNGYWDYEIDKNHNTQIKGQILVPFSPESSLSGVGHILQPDERLRYHRTFSIPDALGNKRLILHFGAVDQECTVFCNGKNVGTHKGGYLPFSFDITPYLDHMLSSQDLIVEVTDATEKAPHARGKQRLKRKGHMSSIFYTPQSGIWKTVWMEYVPPTYISKLHLTPSFDEHTVRITPDIVGDSNLMFSAEISFNGKLLSTQTGRGSILFHMESHDFHTWTPDTPALYDVTVSLGEDRVSSYFGFRKIGCASDKHGILRMTLNNEPYFFNGVLDQGYFPDGLLTSPSDEALISDILSMKEHGFNTIRKHIKIEEERFYYHCDRLGMLVWQDMPNGGDLMNLFFVTDLPNAFPRLTRHIKDSHYRLFRRTDPSGRDQFYSDLSEMIALLHPYPCIVLWTPFNEGWGQFDAKKATSLIRSLDSTRLINEACGWYDQGGGDIYSIHNYLRPFRCKPQRDRVVALTEFGGYACPTPGHMMYEKEFGYKGFQTRDKLTQAYLKLIKRDIEPWIEKGLSAIIYTQTSDVEEEINGFLTYDREVEKMDKQLIRESNQQLYKLFKSLTE